MDAFSTTWLKMITISTLITLLFGATKVQNLMFVPRAHGWDTEQGLMEISTWQNSPCNLFSFRVQRYCIQVGLCDLWNSCNLWLDIYVTCTPNCKWAYVYNMVPSASPSFLSLFPMIMSLGQTCTN